MADGILKEANEKAVTKLKEKYLGSMSVSPKLEEWHGIYDILEVWDSGREDADNKEKTKYVWETLKAQGEPKDQLLSIFSIIGSTPFGETKLNRVYKYLKLKASANKALNEYENIQRDINALRTEK